MSGDITGGCLCGAVRFRFKAEAPVAVRACWCRLCQYIGAGSGTVNAGFLIADRTIESGEMSDYQSVADSGSKMHRRFCTTCGTHIFSESEARPQLTFVRVGTLDEPDRFPPQGTIWTREAPKWACIDASLPQVEAQPPPVA